MGKTVSKSASESAPKTGRETAKPSVPGKKDTGLSGTDPLLVAAQKVVRVHFQRLVHYEKGTRSGEDIEDLHQFRVSTRRLRAALRIFGPYIPGKTATRLREDLRRLTRSCGPARDLDVLIDNAVRFGETLPEAERPTLQPLLDYWETQRKTARANLVAYLDGEEYKALKSDFRAFLKKRPSPNPRRRPRKNPKPNPLYLGHIAPALIWENYQKVRLYETIMNDPPVEALHALRIDCKRLRYAMEMVREVLGEAGEKAIDIVKGAQEHLGEMHDAFLAAQLMWKFIKRRTRQTERTGQPTADIKGVTDYFIACEAAEKKRIEMFPPVWAELSSEEFRRLLAEATATP